MYQEGHFKGLFFPFLYEHTTCWKYSYGFSMNCLSTTSFCSRLGNLSLTLQLEHIKLKKGKSCFFNCILLLNWWKIRHLFWWWKTKSKLFSQKNWHENWSDTIIYISKISIKWRIKVAYRCCVLDWCLAGGKGWKFWN